MQDGRCKAFVYDLVNSDPEPDLASTVAPGSIDLCTMIFMLSAVHPEKIAIVLQKLMPVSDNSAFVLSLGQRSDEKWP